MHSRSPRLPRQRTRQHQRGQALAEIVIALLAVLIPLFVFGWALSAYLSTRNLALSGARYAAWERTVWFERAPTDSPLTGDKQVVKSQAQVQDEMLQRIFTPTSGNGALQSLAGRAPAPRNADAAESTRTHHRDGRKLLELERTGGSGAQGARPTLRLADTGASTSTGVATALEGIGKVTAGISGARAIDLENRGIWRADVAVRPNALDISALSDGRQRTLPVLTFRESAAVMANPWNVGGSAHETTRVEPLVPTSLFDMPVLDAIRRVIGFLVPPLADWDPGHVDADRLPGDRRK